MVTAASDLPPRLGVVRKLKSFSESLSRRASFLKDLTLQKTFPKREITQTLSELVKYVGCVALS